MNPPAHLSSAATVAQPIPFRKESGGIGSSPIGVMLTLVILLTLVWLFALFAKRKGWLDRWAVARPANVKTDDIQVLQTLRLSSRTSIYRLQHGKQVFAVVESSAQVEVRTLDQGEESHAE